MENIVIVSSMTEALRGKKVLEKYGIFSKVQRISAVNKKLGCSFGIVIPKFYQRGIEILKEYGIYPLGQASGDEI